MRKRPHEDIGAIWRSGLDSAAGGAQKAMDPNQAKPGDLLAIWHMAPLASDVINRVQGGRACHHCAVISFDLAGSLDLAVYEAWPPRSRKMSWPAYWRQLQIWASDWRYQRFRRPPLVVELWRFPSITPRQVAGLTSTAAGLLDLRYRMVLEWALGTPKCINCSELAHRCCVAAGLTFQADVRDRRGLPKKMDRVTPWEWVQTLKRRNANRIAEWSRELLDGSRMVSRITELELC